MPTEDGKAKRWRRTDGSEVLWIQDANGIWRNNSSEYEQLTENGAGYSITLTDDDPGFPADNATIALENLVFVDPKFKEEFEQMRKLGLHDA